MAKKNMKANWIGRIGVTAGVALFAGMPFVFALPAPNVKDATPLASQAVPMDHEHFLSQYCSACHNDKAKVAGLSMAGLREADLTNGANDETWEKILRRLSLGEMPPKGMRRPPQADIDSFTGWLETGLDKYASTRPNPGRATLRRMNRAEYANAVRDLLHLDVDVSDELPADDSGYGFDNIADVLTISPTLMDRYVAVAGKVTRLATALSSQKPVTTEYNPPKDPSVSYKGMPAYNVRASDDLPLDSRGGGSFNFYAPFDATYTLRVYLNSNSVSDKELLKDNMYEVKVPLKAGNRVIGVSFQKPLGLQEVTQHFYSGINGFGVGAVVMPAAPPVMLPMNFQVDGAFVKTIQVPSFNVSQIFVQDNWPRDILQLDVEGPYDIKGAGNTPSRERIFICKPSRSLSESACARKILTSLAGTAYRRPVTQADISPLMKVYDFNRKGADFEHGVEAGVEAILVSPQFLFVQETDPKGSAPGSVHPISDLELASRLSFFLWSSLPDQELVKVAERGQLHNPAMLKRQVTRMLADPRSEALTQNFAAQWLYLRNLEYARPDLTEFPKFDERLRQAMLMETNMFFSSIVHDNRSILDFINADYTYLNQRLAEHYGIPGVYGTSFRKVMLDPASHRGGLLGQGSILTVTSFDNRTSEVRRGKWILDNLLAASPPPPPPNTPGFPEIKNGNLLTVRETMEIHRANPVCAACHAKMDPLGFSLENYDATGAWRDTEAGKPVDTSAVLPDGTKFNGPTGLQGILLARKDQFVEAFTERLMTYALGRGVEGYDMPAVRNIRRQVVKDGYKIDSVIMGIVQSVPFEMRTTPEAGGDSDMKKVTLR